MGIEVRDVRYGIDGKEIIKGVTLAVRQGMIGLIGPNGAGKTTLLRIISGYLKPDFGEVLLDGVPVHQTDVKTRARKMALVPQSYALEYDFTVLETVLMGRNPHKKLFESDTAEDIALARRCIREAGIAELETRSIIGLSGGEWQRMIIARALCQQSNILLLDEPVSSLDIKHQVGILGTVRRLVRENGLVCVCVLHDLNLASHYCDRIALIKDGTLRETGTPEEVMKKEILECVYETEIRVVRDGGQSYILPVMDT